MAEEQEQKGQPAKETSAEEQARRAQLDKLSDDELLSVYRAMPGQERNESAAAFNFFPLIIALVAFLLDQYIKFIAISTFKLNGQVNGAPISIVGDVFTFVYSENTGGAFSLLRGQSWLFTVFSSVIIVVLVFIIFRYPRLVASSFWVGLGLGMVLGGASGNLADRLRQGYVVDMWRFWWGDFRWPTFNTADSFVVVGFIILGIYGLGAGWFSSKEQSAQEARLWQLRLMITPNLAVCATQLSG